MMVTELLTVAAMLAGCFFFFTGTLGLLGGLRIHVLDVRRDPEARLRPLEARVGAMFAEGEAH